jgi:hypothetical protein
MFSLTTNPAGRATSTHRAQIVAEAVVSAYIHEISGSEHRRERDRHSCEESSPTAIARSPLAVRRRNRARRRRTGLSSQLALSG